MCRDDILIHRAVRQGGGEQGADAGEGSTRGGAGGGGSGDEGNCGSTRGGTCGGGRGVEGVG
jgi:hypothetical protein